MNDSVVGDVGCLLFVDCELLFDTLLVDCVGGSKFSSFFSLSLLSDSLVDCG